MLLPQEMAALGRLRHFIRETLFSMASALARRSDIVASSSRRATTRSCNT